MELLTINVSSWSISFEGYLGDLYLPWRTLITAALIAGTIAAIRKIKKAR